MGTSIPLIYFQKLYVFCLIFWGLHHHFTWRFQCKPLYFNFLGMWLVFLFFLCFSIWSMLFLFIFIFAISFTLYPNLVFLLKNYFLFLMCNLGLSVPKCFSPIPIVHFFPHPFFLARFPGLIHEFCNQESVKLFFCLAPLSIWKHATVSSINQAICAFLCYSYWFCSIVVPFFFPGHSMFSRYIIERCFHQWKSSNFSLFLVFICSCIYPNLVLTLTDLLWFLLYHSTKYFRKKLLNLNNYVINCHYY